MRDGMMRDRRLLIIFRAGRFGKNISHVPEERKGAIKGQALSSIHSNSSHQMTILLGQLPKPLAVAQPSVVAFHYWDVNVFEYPTGGETSEAPTCKTHGFAVFTREQAEDAVEDFGREVIDGRVLHCRRLAKGWLAIRTC